MATMKQCDKCGKTVPYKEAYFIKVWRYTEYDKGDWVMGNDLCEACYEALMEKPQAAEPLPLTDGLKSCPFCGSEARKSVLKLDELISVHQVICASCGASTCSPSVVPEYCVDLWNRRV